MSRGKESKNNIFKLTYHKMERKNVFTDITLRDFFLVSCASHSTLEMKNIKPCTKLNYGYQFNLFCFTLSKRNYITT